MPTPKSRANKSSPPAGFGAKILDMARQLARFSETPDGLTCTYLSPAHKAAAAQLRDWMRAAGLTAQIDAVGNVVGRYSSAAPAAKTLIVASHYDTVVNAGRFDGRLGILTALAVAEHLAGIGRALPFHLDVIGFAEEEGVRFAAPYLGSSAIAGRFDAAVLQRSDKDGVRLGSLLQEQGVDRDAIARLARPPETLRGYLEVHIEQGPVLLDKNLPVGIVTAIAGSARFHISVRGTAGHAGTVPMALRHDAAAAAAEIVLAVERRCSEAANSGRHRGPARGAARLDQCHPRQLRVVARCARRRTIPCATRAIADIVAAAQSIAARRGVTVEISAIGAHSAVPCSPAMQAALAQSVARTGIAPFHLASGAGHDAAMFAGLTEIGMLFVRCGNGGISHSPLETVTAEDADVAARVLLDVLVNLT